jgi:hypothetical protein
VKAENAFETMRDEIVQGLVPRVAKSGRGRGVSTRDMAWETRNGNRYYYRSVRDGDRVRKEYVGTGPLALLAAEADEARRLRRQRKRERERAELERLREADAVVERLCEDAETLARAVLMASGYTNHKGEWRMRRGR